MSAVTHLDGLHVDIGSDPVFTGHLGTVHSQGEILGHDSVDIDGLGTALFELGGKLGQLGGVVELGSEGETSGPGKDRGDRVGRGLVALLELSVVSSDGTWKASDKMYVSKSGGSDKGI
jgi:hypothetical protein